MHAPAVWTDLAARGRARAVVARQWFDRTRAEAERRFPVLTELTSRLLSANLLDAASRLAAQAFLTTIPLLFAFSAFAPEAVRDQLMSSVRAVFGLTGAAGQQFQQVVNGGTGTEGEEFRETTGVIGALMALISATSFSRAMTRLCERAWRLPKSGARVGAWRWLVWVLVLVALLLFQGPVRDGFGAGLWLGVPLSFLDGVAVWWWSQHLLLAGRVPWLPLLPGSVLASAALTAMALTARIYIPNALNRALGEYGSLGLVLTLLSWLIALCAALTFAVTIGAVLAEGPPLNRWLPPVPRPPAGPGAAAGPAGRPAADQSAADQSAADQQGSTA
ncbi:YhjD/YihY/BrkB family envelope integrity protein [Streptacidiphilus sp. P02-A3a]|uniref:YhjD/YihY/BrkB family envelope integrity protein n=1 Tax=Streptacidiphilus sp. P02-A3a TaxID=2704468 RepID=UPI0015FC67E7|nr:YhjD/YihY/BrkB family envelope integrity protein [Streptacidiphilus sp. P02-A3a]QMU68040.1 ribonuclease BN [Streptacidiphilus sp. P02-A3a]